MMVFDVERVACKMVMTGSLLVSFTCNVVIDLSPLLVCSSERCSVFVESDACSLLVGIKFNEPMIRLDSRHCGKMADAKDKT